MLWVCYYGNKEKFTKSLFSENHLNIMDTNDNAYLKTVRNTYKKHKGNTKGKLVGRNDPK